jgi:hypothetical protein
MRKVENFQVLLEDVRKACGSAIAESEPEDESGFMKGFLPVRRHLRVLDSQVRLVVGDKGAGKSHLFKALRFARARELLVNLATEKGYDVRPLDRTTWLVGFDTSREFPPADVIDAFVRNQDTDPNTVRMLWMMLLVDVLRRSNHLDCDGTLAELAHILRSGRWDLPGLLSVVRKPDSQAAIYAAIDQCDRRLSEKDQDVIITYDELDRLSPSDWTVMRKALGGLIQFWATYFKRWQRIRCKIFLRRDLYEHTQIQGPDLAKIAWNPVDLFWNAGEVYALLFKRLANTSEALQEYLSPRLKFTSHPLMGWMVNETMEEDDFASAIELLVGKYMGTDRRKGLTLRWISNHLKDGHGRVFPRPLLRLIASAVELEGRDRHAERPHILHFTAVRGALDKVSEYRIEELAQEEFPWLRRLQVHLKEHPFNVPCSRREALNALEVDWSQERASAPATEPNALLEYLTEIGLFVIRTSDHRVDVGDLYLKGLGLKRKGGVARPKSFRAH